MSFGSEAADIRSTAALVRGLGDRSRGPFRQGCSGSSRVAFMMSSRPRADLHHRGTVAIEMGRNAGRN